MPNSFLPPEQTQNPRNSSAPRPQSDVLWTWPNHSVACYVTIWSLQAKSHACGHLSARWGWRAYICWTSPLPSRARCLWPLAGRGKVAFGVTALVGAAAGPCLCEHIQKQIKTTLTSWESPWEKSNTLHLCTLVTLLSRPSIRRSRSFISLWGRVMECPDGQADERNHPCTQGAVPTSQLIGPHSPPQIPFQNSFFGQSDGYYCRSTRKEIFMRQ